MTDADVAESTIDDVELAILESIYSSEKQERSLTQRELAEASGLSLGMTNAILKRFAQKGWVMLRKLNSRTIKYAITPAGVNEVARRAYRYFRRTARNTGMYKDILEEFVMHSKLQGKTRLVLVGSSDIDFILEYACERQGVLFIKASGHDKAL
ncbi:MAG: winged helix-turn-helix transcriptional regulator, partial [Spirochaetes bacterium]|nr:winged helix-turn-helix transcriptional regulator [Spirochaetota bacterium]MBU0954457.1 winged helix-turn-helix transcriptional regulator [Spirochaetota bacterium]